jgi:hypothetical protein
MRPKQTGDEAFAHPAARSIRPIHLSLGGAGVSSTRERGALSDSGQLSALSFQLSGTIPLRHSEERSCAWIAAELSSWCAMGLGSRGAIA